MKIFSRIRERLKKRHGGFTLLEMMLVLLVLSLVSGLFVSARISIMTDQKKEVTVKRMDTVQKQLVWYRQINHRLPCPASNTLTLASTSYGLEQAVGTCDPSLDDYPSTLRLADGAVPTKTIGLADEFMYDGWGRRFRYMVMQEFTKPCAFATHPVTPVGYTGLVILDEYGNVLSTQKLYVIVSFGMDGHGGYLQSGSRLSSGALNSNELENCDCDSAGNTTYVNNTFVDAPFRYSDPGAQTTFSHILRYASREQIPSQEDLNGATENCTSGTSASSSSGGSSSSGSSGGSSGSSSSSSSSGGPSCSDPTLVSKICSGAGCNSMGCAQSGGTCAGNTCSYIPTGGSPPFISCDCVPSGSSSGGGSSGGACNCVYINVGSYAACQSGCNSMGASSYSYDGFDQCTCLGPSACGDMNYLGWNLISNNCGSAGGGSSGGGSSGSSSGAGSSSSAGGGGTCWCDQHSGCTGTSFAGHACAQAGETCGSQGNQCCPGYACVSGSCVSCGSPPYAAGCGCTSPSDCSGGACAVGCYVGYCSGGGLGGNCPCQSNGSCDPVGCGATGGHCVGITCCWTGMCCACLQ